MKKIFAAFLFIATLVLGGSVTRADISVVSTQVINDVKVTLSDDNKSYKIGFSVNSNGENAADFKYGIILMPVTDGLPDFTVVADEKIFDDVSSLSKGQMVSKEISYTPPTTLSGTYRMMIETKNSSGLTLASSFAKDITLSQVSGNGIYVDTKSCFLTVDGDEKKYDLVQGVDILPGEILQLSCSVKNLSSTIGVSVLPSFVTNQRNSFGKVVKMDDAVMEPITLNVGESKVITLDIPQPKNPQAYNTTVTLNTIGQIKSNPITVHWILQGDSATIQNVTLDKGSYNFGDKLTAKVLWSGSAGAFPGSRIEAQSNNTTYKLVTNFCGETNVSNLDRSVSVVTVSIKAIPASCVNPELALSISANDVDLFDSTTSVPMGKNSLANNSGQKNPIWDIIMTIVALAIAISLGFVIVNLKKRKLIGMIVLGLVVCGVNSAEASTARYYRLDSLDKNNVYICTTSSVGFKNFLGSTVFSVGDKFPVYEQSNPTDCATLSTTSYDGVLKSNSNYSRYIYSDGVVKNGVITLSFKKNIFDSKPMTVSATSTKLQEYGQFDIIANTAASITGFENKSETNLIAQGKVAAKLLPKSGTASAPTVTIPNVKIESGASFNIGSHTFIGRTMLYNSDSVLIAKSGWSQYSFYIRPPDGGISVVSSGGAELSIVTPAGGNVYKFPFAMTDESFSPSVQYYSGETIYLKSILSVTLLWCTNGARGTLSSQYQIHSQDTSYDPAKWINFPNNKDYVPVANDPKAPLAPGKYYMDMRIYQNINLYHAIGEEYQYGIVRVPFTVSAYPKSLTVTPQACQVGQSNATTSVDLAWDNSIVKVSPVADYLKNGYAVTAKIMRLMDGDAVSKTVNVASSSDLAFSSTSTVSTYSSTDKNLIQGTTYYYWPEWTLSKTGKSSVVIKDKTNEYYTVTNSCVNPVSCNLSISGSNMSWSTTGSVDTCKINGAVVSGVNGSKTIDPTKIMNYTLQCYASANPSKVCTSITSPASQGGGGDGGDAGNGAGVDLQNGGAGNSSACTRPQNASLCTIPASAPSATTTRVYNTNCPASSDIVSQCSFVCDSGFVVGAGQCVKASVEER